MNSPTPAIVAQGSVRRLPRSTLWLLSLTYMLAGFIGREPWRNADITALGYMLGLLQTGADWFSPQLMGLAPEVDALLPYWLGSWAMQGAPTWLAPDFAARIPFIAMLGVSMAATWYATYYLARSPKAQPVTFAFGGEASVPDYARAMADGGLLAFIACLGLAQLSHETTPAQAQLCFVALTFFGLSALPYRIAFPLIGIAIGLVGMVLSGAPAMAVLFGTGGAVAYAINQQNDAPSQATSLSTRNGLIFLALVVLGCIGLATALDLWHWRIQFPESRIGKWIALSKLLIWFTWPAWPLVLWTLWRWRRQLGSRHPSLHLTLPLWFASVAIGTTIFTTSTDRSLLLALPALAALAAFALPTLERSVSALIDWFTLLFFSGLAIIIWALWIAVQTGTPSQLVANVARQAPGLVHTFASIPFLLALLATLAWIGLVKWRVGRHRAAIWKSLVLPASGAVLSWLLLTSLGMPVLNYVRSDTVLVNRVSSVVKSTNCLQVHGLSRNRIAALQFHGSFQLKPANGAAICDWLVVDRNAQNTLSSVTDTQQWQRDKAIRHPANREDNLYLYRRKTTSNL